MPELFSYPETAFLAGMPTGFVKAVAQRGQLATWSNATAPESVLEEIETLENAAISKRNSTSFSAIDAVMIAVQCEFMRRIGSCDGIGASSAQTVVLNSGALVVDYLMTRGGADRWIGYAGEPTGYGVSTEPRSSGYRSGGRCLFGTLTEIASKLDAIAPQDIDFPEGPVRLTLVNVSRVLRDVEMRANERQIPFMTVLYAELRAKRGTTPPAGALYTGPIDPDWRPAMKRRLREQGASEE